MSGQPPASFGALLRRYRLAKGWTQEELADHARVSVEAVSALERGIRRLPRKETVDLLAEALALSEEECAAFIVAARQQRVANARSSTSPVSLATELEAPRPGEMRPSRAVHQVPRVQELYYRLSSSFPRRDHKVIASLVILLALGMTLLAGSHTFAGGGVLCLATDFPTSGRYAPTKALEYAVNLAVLQNERLENGYTLRVINYDDTSPETRDFDPQIGAYNVRKMAQDSCIVGVVGPGNSDVAAATLPIAAKANLVMISPSTTRSGLTLRPFAILEGWDFDLFHPTGKPLTFFRTVPNDVAQGLVAANYTFDDLGARSVYVVNARERFGEDLVGGFTQAFQRKGGRIIGIDSIPSANSATIADIAARIVAGNPDAVYYAGINNGGGGQLKAKLVKQGYSGPFVGGEGIATDPGFVEDAGATAANGAMAIAPFFHLSSTSSDAAARFIRDYHERYPGQSLDPGAAEAYDGTMVLITVINRILREGQRVTRERMSTEIQQIHYEGVIGPISFDANGDIARGTFGVYRVQNGRWIYLQQIPI